MRGVENVSPTMSGMFPSMAGNLVFDSKIRFTKMLAAGDDVFDRIETHLATKLAIRIAKQCATDQKNSVDITELERSKFAAIYGVTEKRIANVLSELSRPIEKGGVEILVKLAPSKYMLNPTIFHVGRTQKQQDSVEDYHKLRRRRIERAKARKRDGKEKPVKATVTQLTAIQGGKA